MRRFVFAFLAFASVPVFALSSGLSSKLDRQWDKYSAARALLLQQVQKTDLPVDQRLISRETWEALLENDFTAADLARLRADQKRRIFRARRQSRLQSKIDFNEVRFSGRVHRFCAEVPKGGMLHIHPEGIVHRAEVAHLLGTLNPVLSVNDIFSDIDSSNGDVSLGKADRDWLSKLDPKSHYNDLSMRDRNRFAEFLFLPPGKQRFPRFNGVFEFLGFVIPDWPSFTEILTRFAQEALREGVEYVEFTGGTSPKFVSVISALEQKTGLTMRVNEAFVRTSAVEDIQASWQKFLSQPKSPYVVGIDFLDNEAMGPALEKGQLLYGSALTSGFHRTMHAGEIGDIRNPRDAMIMGAERLGHGVNLAKDPVALEYAAKIHEPVETNISSNLRLTDVTSVETHPFLNYLRLGLKVSLSTDDEGIFDTDIVHECELVLDHTDVTYAEFKQMAVNSIETSFLSDADKQRLLSDLRGRFRRFEESWF